MQRRCLVPGLVVAAAICSLVAAEPVERSTNQFRPVDLDRFYQRTFASYKPTDSWAMVPRGVTNLDGVPFRMFGKIDLTGLGRARDGEFQPARIGEIPVGQRAARLHLIHGASYDTPDDTPTACLLLHYKSGEDRKLFIRYGVHVRNWYIERSEQNASLSDPRSLVVWNGNTRADGRGTPLRLFKTTFENPRPTEEIRAIELLSLFARANSVILAITLEESSTDNPLAVQSPEETDDIDLRREILVRTLDANTARGVSNVVSLLYVTEAGRSYRFGNYKSDAHGQILIDYPPGKFEMIRFTLGAPGYAPLLFTTNSDEGVYAAELPIRLTPAPTRPASPALKP
jgi:hypothetical protein